MAPEPTVLKRQRSRPSEWWAASPSTSETAIPPPAALFSKKAIATSKLSATGNSSPSVAPPKKIMEKEPIQKAPSEPRGTLNSPQATERASLKRKRTRPSDWWAASPVVQPAEQSILQESPRKVSQQLGQCARKPSAAVAEATQPKKASRKPVNAAGPIFADSSDSENRVSKRKRARPSDWWAANPSTPTQENELTESSRGETAEERNSKQILKDVPSRGNQVKAVSRVEGGKGTSKPKATEGLNRPQQAGTKKGDSKPKESRRGTPPRVLSQRMKKSLDQELPEDELAKPTVKNAKQLRRSRQSKFGEGGQPIFLEASVVENSKGNDAEASTQNSNAAFEELINDEERVKGRPRTRQSDVRIKDSNSSVNPTKEQTLRKRQNGSGEVIEVQTASSSFGRSRAKREVRVEPVVENPKTKASNSVASGKGRKIAGSQMSRTPSNSVSKPQSKKAAGVSEINATKKKRKSKDKIVEPVRGAKRSRISDADQEEDDDEEDLPQYQRLGEVTRRVNRTTIEKSWGPLPNGSVELLSQLLSDTQRPVVVRIVDINKRVQANTALQMISRRLMSKVSKGLPFPKGVSSQREDDFNFEKIIDRNRMLEGQLSAEMDANKLLEDNLNQELSRLEAEKAILTELEANAKTESALRKEAGRKAHPLLQSVDPSDAAVVEDSSNLGVSRVLPSLGVSADEDLQTVVRDLEGHVESLQGNFKPLSGLPEAMAKAKAAVQITLFDHLESDGYEDVVLGPEGASND